MINEAVHDPYSGLTGDREMTSIRSTETDNPHVHATLDSYGEADRILLMCSDAYIHFLQPVWHYGTVLDCTH